MAATTVVQQKNSVIQGNGAEPHTRYWLSSQAEPTSLVELETASTVLNIRGNHGGFPLLLTRTRVAASTQITAQMAATIDKTAQVELGPRASPHLLELALVTIMNHPKKTEGGS